VDAYPAIGATVLSKAVIEQERGGWASVLAGDLWSRNRTDAAGQVYQLVQSRFASVRQGA